MQSTSSSSDNITISNQMVEQSKRALSYAAYNWSPETLEIHAHHYGLKIYAPSGEPTLIGHNLTVQFDHHWAGGCNRLEQYEEALSEWKTKLNDQLRSPFYQYFLDLIEQRIPEEIIYWTKTYNFLRSNHFI